MAYLPVSCADVAAVIGRNAATVDDYTENHETNTGCDLDHADDKFDLAVATVQSQKYAPAIKRLRLTALRSTG